MDDLIKQFYDRADEIAAENAGGADYLADVALKMERAADEGERKAIVQAEWNRLKPLMPKDEQGAIEQQVLTIVTAKPPEVSKEIYAPSGMRQFTLDNLMEAYGVIPFNNGGYTDDQRAAFTNPDSKSYYAKSKSPEVDLITATRYLGLPNEYAPYVQQMLDNEASKFQRTLRVEGWGADNSFHPLDWAWSAAKGIVTPRIKESQLAGREISWQDIVGDLAEAGLSFVPGVGIVSKGGKVIAQLPKVAKAVDAAPTVMRVLGKGTQFAADQAVAPLGAEAMDAWLYREQPYNDRSQFSWGDVGTNMAGSAAFTGVLKGAGMAGKNYLEARMGGGKASKDAVHSFAEGMESIGENTDELLAQRQAMLDYKASLARDYGNVASLTREGVTPGQIGLAREGLSVVPMDIDKAEEYRLLQKYAAELAAGKTVIDETVDGSRLLVMEDGVLKAIPMQGGVAPTMYPSVMEDRYKILSPEYADGGMSSVIKQPGTNYYTARPNELTVFGKTENPNFGGVSYELPAIVGDYDEKKVADAITAINQMRSGNQIDVDDAIDVLLREGKIDAATAGKLSFAHANGGLDRLMSRMGSIPTTHPLNIPVTTNVAHADATQTVLSKIGNDPLLRRKLDRYYALKETVRDELAGAAGFRATRPESGVASMFGAGYDDQNSREIALANAQNRKLREYVLGATSNEEKMQRMNRVMDVQRYGFENLPMSDDDLQNGRKIPQAYQEIYELLMK